MRKLVVGSLFAGIGGFDLGLEMAGGFEIAWQIEIDPFCQKVLAKHWPHVARYGDIRACGNSRTYALSPVDVLCGGFPCQPHSLAGRRQASKDERDLWTEFARLIRELRPRWVLVENVMGLLSSESGHFFGTVLGDLDACGYDAEWLCLRASDVGAPHRRERIFIVAYSHSQQPQRRRNNRELAGTKRETQITEEERERHGHAAINSSQIMVYSHSQRLQRGRDRAGISSSPPGASTRDQQGSSAWDGWRETGPTLSNMGRMLNGLPAGMDGYQWVARPGEPQHAWEPPRTTTGKQPHRVARLKALGNAIVPQLVAHIGRCIVAREMEGRNVA